MSFADCLRDAIDEGSADPVRGARAQAMWEELADRYEANGHPRHLAEVMAAEDVKKAFRKEAGDARHVALAQMAIARRMQAEVEKAKAPDMRATIERVEYRQRGLVRRFNGRLSEFLSEHHRSITGTVKRPAQLMNVVKELHLESSGDATAKSLADGIRSALEDMRLMANEAGAIIPKLDGWGLPHSHSRAAIRRAGFDRWRTEIEPKIEWTKTVGPSGEPFSTQPDPATREAFLRATYENIVFGRDVENPVYGKVKGTARYRRHAQQRVLAFRSAEDWIAYNRVFGSGDPFKSLMGHVHGMARDIALMREFGPNPKLGAEYRADLWRAKLGVEGKESLFEKATGDIGHGLRMFNVLSGGARPETPLQDWLATFMSSTRHVLTSAQLDRAVVASMSDLNTMKLAAESLRMNPASMVGKQVGALATLSKEDLKRAGWVADTLADPGTALARFQNEIAPAEVAERLSSAAMRVQGLSAWTDRARSVFYQETTGAFAAFAGKRVSEVDEPWRSLLERHGVTDEDLAQFTSTMFTAGNGATFAMPIYWRQATDLPARKADAIFDKFQGLLEEQMEIAVPTGSLLARGIFDPAAYNLPPGSIAYEFMKSAGMFKSFPMTFAVSQYRQIMARPTLPGRIGYALNLAAGATIMGALSLQIGDLLLGRDPQDMSKPMFWVRAAMKGGAFGIVGDIVATGQASWGGGFGSYLLGPVPQLVDDVYNLTLKNAVQLAMGEDTNFAEELSRFGRRYTPMGQTVAIGPALDRLFWDQMQLFLDPDSVEALARSSRNRQNLTGAAEWWLPGEPLPSRGPAFGL